MESTPVHNKNDDSLHLEDSNLLASIVESNASIVEPKQASAEKVKDIPSPVKEKPSLEDELLAAIDSINETSELVDAIQDFESASGKLRAKINSLEASAQRLNVVPNVTKACFSTLQKSMTQASKASDGTYEPVQEDCIALEEQIKQASKDTSQVMQQFTTLKSQLFAINEPIVNKDITMLSVKQVQRQRERLDKLQSTALEFDTDLQAVETVLDDLQDDFLIYLQDAFKISNDLAQSGLQGVKNEQGSIQRSAIQAKDILAQICGLLKVKPASKEAKQQLTEHSMALSKLDRMNQSWNQSSDGFQKDLRGFEANLEPINDMVSDEVDEPKGSTKQLAAILPRTKQFDKMTEVLGTGTDLNEKNKKLTEELAQILESANSLLGVVQQFSESVNAEKLKAFEDLLQQAKALEIQLSCSTKDEAERLDAFESRISEFNVSDTDQFFMGKEVTRHRNTISNLNAQGLVHQETCQDIEARITEQSDTVTPDDLKSLEGTVKSLTRLLEADVPKLKEGIDNLEAFISKGLKNQLNSDNKRSQTNLSKVKKAYEEFVRNYEALENTYNDCVEQVNSFNDKFVSDDLERMNEIEQLKENLLKKENAINGSDNSLLIKKRQVIEGINKCVDQFNDITKMTRDSNRKNLKSETVLNDLITKNKDLQSACDSLGLLLSRAKTDAQDTSDQLSQLINSDTMQELTSKYSTKEQLVQECSKQKDKIEKMLSKVDNQLVKQSETLDQSIKRLEMFNPILGHGARQGGVGDEEEDASKREFYTKVSDLTDKAHELSDQLRKVQEEQSYLTKSIETSHSPVKEMGTREVDQAEIEQVQKTLDEIHEDVQTVDADLQPRVAEIATLQKAIKELVDEQLDARLNEGTATIEALDKDLTKASEAHGTSKKKLKYLKELIDKAQRNQGKQDIQLQEKLLDLHTEVTAFDDSLKDLDGKIQDMRKKKTELKRQVDEIVRTPTKFKPHNVDTLLATLDEQRDKQQNLTDRLSNFDTKIDKKTRDLSELLASYDTRQGLHGQIKVTEMEYDDDLQQMREILDKMPVGLKQVKRTVTEMKESAAQGDDFDERKEEIEEQLEDISKIEDELKELEEQYHVFEGKRKEFAKLKEAKDVTGLQKVHDQIKETKNALANLLGETADTQDSLEELRRDVGDCNIPMIVQKRRKELQQFSQRFERANKELLNLKKTLKKPHGLKQKETASEEAIQKMLKEVEARLKVLSKDRQEATRQQLRELDGIAPLDYDDFTKNHDIIKKLRTMKHGVDDSDIQLKEVEDLKAEVVKKLTEQDMENLTEMLEMRITDLKERSAETSKQLNKFRDSCEAMDGNASNGEEELLVEAIKDELPSKIEHITDVTTEIEKLEDDMQEVLKSADIAKMDTIRKRAGKAQESVEELEALVNKLDKEMLNWNGQRKLTKRDVELEEAMNLCNDFLEDLMQERQNTEIELERNREKQDENRGQEMVDKDGNKVDIVGDLERLEQQMQAYIADIDEQISEVKAYDQAKDELFEAFDSELPSIIKEERKRRQAGASKGPKKQVQSKVKDIFGSSIRKSVANPKQPEEDSIAMLKVNAAYKSKIKTFCKDLKQFNKKRKELEEKYSNLRKEVFKLKQIKLYKPVAGDVVDEAFAQHLNKANLTIEVVRTGEGKYKFGERNIMAKIINGRLVIRVGGGYMNASEFIQQYGKIEMLKMMKREQEAAGGGEERKESDNLGGSNRPGHAHRPSTAASNLKAMLANDIKERMRMTLANVSKTTTKDALSQSNQPRKTYAGGKDMGSLALASELDKLKNDFQKVREKSPNTKNAKDREAWLKLPGVLKRGSMGDASGLTPLTPKTGTTRKVSPSSGLVANKDKDQGLSRGTGKTGSKIGLGVKRGTVLLEAKSLAKLQPPTPSAKDTTHGQSPK